MKKIISLLLTGTIVFSLSGCFGKSESRITTEDVKNRVIGEAEEYLKENYPDDTFTYVSGRSPNWAYQYYELAFSSAEYDNQELTVFAEPDEKLKNDEGLTVYHYCDNYFQYYMKDEAEEYFYNVAKEYLGEDITVKMVFMENIGASKQVDNEIGFIQNIIENNLVCTAKIYITEYTESTKEKFEYISQRLLEEKCNIDIMFLFKEDSTADEFDIIEFKIKDGKIKEKKL